MSSSDRTPPHPSPLPQGERERVTSGIGRSAFRRAPPSPLGGEGWGEGQLSRRFLLLAPLALAACGFAPVNAPGGAISRLHQRIRVDDPSDKNGFDFVERMEERLGRPEAAAYDLSYTITTTAVGVGFTIDSEITRYNLEGVIDYSLTERGTGARVAGGKAQSFTAYSATGSTVAGLAAEEDAAFRLMRILADQVVARLIAVSATLP